jgi:hypothetical protein
LFALPYLSSGGHKSITQPTASNPSGSAREFVFIVRKSITQPTASNQSGSTREFVFIVRKSITQPTARNLSGSAQEPGFIVQSLNVLILLQWWTLWPALQVAEALEQAGRGEIVLHRTCWQLVAPWLRGRELPTGNFCVTSLLPGEIYYMYQRLRVRR